MALFNLLFVGRSFFFTTPLSLVNALQNLKQTLWRRWTEKPCSLWGRPCTKLPQFSPVGCTPLVPGHSLRISFPALWANTALVQSQPGRFDASLGDLNCKTDGNHQFWVVSRKVLSIGRKRRGRYSTEQPAKHHKGRTEARVT